MIARIETLFVAANRWLIGLMMVVMFVLVFTNVVTRYGFGFSINWAEEVSRFIMVWVTFLGAGLALREGRHVSIDVLQERLGGAAMQGIRIFLGVVLIVFFIGLVYLGTRFAIFGWDKETMVTEIPRGIPYLAIPIGMTFLTIHFLLFFRRYVARDWESMVEPDLADEELPAGRDAPEDRP